MKTTTKQPIGFEYGLSSTQPSREQIQAHLDDQGRLADETAGELVLVRHAEPAYGAGADPLLSCAGLAQAENLADRLSSLWSEAVYTAPERRAQQTARILASVSDRPVHVLECLAEIEFDAAKALPVPEYAERFADVQRWDALPGFESGKQFRRRAIQGIERILAISPARRVVVVTHASVINAYISMLLSVPSDQFFTPEYTSISVVRWQEGRYALRCLNDTAHVAWGGPLPAPAYVTEPKYASMAAGPALTSR